MDYSRAIIDLGNMERMKNLMKRAEAGGSFTMVYLGGSITQDCITTKHELCYAYQVNEWWKKTFPKSEFTYVNAGIGATTSQYGVARVEQHVLRHEPDFVVVEFSVNDQGNDFFAETYEGLLRKILKYKTKPAVLVVNTVQYEDGVNAQEYHNRLAKAYGLPICSMKNSLYQETAEGTMNAKDFTVDFLHPNDDGHRMMADIIGYTLEEIKNKPDTCVRKEELPEKPLTANGFEHSVLFQSYNAKPECIGFIEDTAKQEAVKDVFKNGWISGKQGDSITFEAECESIAVQYRKTIQQPTPIAVAIVDGDEANAVTLDGNFDERWGDCPFITTVAQGLPKKKHSIEIRIAETHPDDLVPFYLIGLIVSSGM